MIALALAMMLAVPVDPDNAPAKMITVYGIGGASCAKAMDPQHRSEAFAWVMGYFTARNEYSLRQVQGTDGEGVFGEITLCRAAPSQDLAAAAENVFRQLRR